MADAAPWFPCWPKSTIRVGPKPGAILLIATLAVDSWTEAEPFGCHKMRSLRAESRKGNSPVPMGVLREALRTG